jgi:hypothetical protein
MGGRLNCPLSAAIVNHFTYVIQGRGATISAVLNF